MTHPDRTWRPSALAGFGMPGMPLALLGLPVVMLLPAAYASLPGLDVTSVGIALLLAKLWDFASDPIIGGLSDRSSSRMRRRILMVAGVPVLLAGLYFLAEPSADADFAYLLFYTAVFYTGWTLIAVPYLAWGAELSTTRHLQNRIASAREAWVVAGLLLCVTWILPDAANSPLDSFGRLSDLALILLPIAVLVALLATTEPEATGRAAVSSMPWTALRHFARDPATRLLFASFVLNGIANAIPASLFLLFVTHYLQSPEASTGLLAAYFAAGLVGLLGWQPVIRRWGATSAWIGSMIAASCAFLWVPLLGSGDVWPFAIICAISGMSVGVDMALPAALQAGLLQRRRFAVPEAGAGLAFGAWGMATKLAMAMGIGVAFPLLGAAGFDPAGENSSGALVGLALIYGSLPIVFKLGAILLALRFRHRHETDTDLPEVHIAVSNSDRSYHRGVVG